MEILANVWELIWQGLEEYEVPILNISFKTFLVGQLLLIFLIGLLKFFLGMSYNERDK